MAPSVVVRDRSRLGPKNDILPRRRSSPSQTDSSRFIIERLVPVMRQRRWTIMVTLAVAGLGEPGLDALGGTVHVPPGAVDTSDDSDNSRHVKTGSSTDAQWDFGDGNTPVGRTPVALVRYSAIGPASISDWPIYLAPSSPSSFSPATPGWVDCGFALHRFGSTWAAGEIVLNPTAAAILYVDAGATGANDGSSWDDAYNDLQDALAAASAGDEIWVARGTYRPTTGTDQTATFQLIDEVEIYGGFAGSESVREQRDWVTNETILSGEFEDSFNPRQDNSDHVTTGSGTDASAVLDGFTIAYGGVWGALQRGAGMINDGGSPTLRNLHFYANRGRDGGAIYNVNGSAPRIEACVFTSNAGEFNGGAIYNVNSGPEIVECRFLGNVAILASGGAIAHTGSVNMHVSDSQFIGNYSEECCASAVSVSGESIFENVLFEDNRMGLLTGSATLGGTVRCLSGSPTFRNVAFVNNWSFVGTAGILNYSASPVLINVTFFDNEAVGYGPNPPGAGVLYNVSGFPTLVNVVSWNNRVIGNGVDGIYNETGNCTISYSLIEGCGGSGAGWDASFGVDGGANLDSDPLFLDPIRNNLNLTVNSPARNAGNNSAVPPAVEIDLGGCQRIIEGVVDMGAYEFSPLVINEFPPAAAQEFVEIRNLSSAQLDISGYRIRYELEGLVQEELLPMGSLIAPGGLLVHYLTTISLGDEGGSVSLFAPLATHCLDMVSYGFAGGAPTVPAAFTTSRVEGTDAGAPDDESFELGDPTPNQSNETATPDLGGSIVFNEVVFAGGSPENPDYIELYNPQAMPVDLSQFAIGFGFDSIELVQLSAELEPGERIWIRQGDPGSFQQDIQSGLIYLYRLDSQSRLQRVDQLAWIPKVPGETVPQPGAPPYDALIRIPDGNAVYAGDRGANWEECGGDTALFFGERSPGALNEHPYTSTHEVDAGGLGSFLSLGEALSWVEQNPDSDGDHVVLSPGEYSESITLVVGVEITGLRSPFAPFERAVLSGSPGGGDSIVEADDAEFSSTCSTVVISGGASSQGGGLTIRDGRPIFRNVVFESNQSSGAGGAVAVLGGNAVFQGCVFRGNLATTDGGAVYIALDPNSNDDVTFRDCLFIGNQALRGGSIFVQGGDVTIDHCIFDGNEATGAGSGDLHNVGGELVVTYSTVTGAIGDYALFNQGLTTQFIFDCGLTYGNANGGLTPTRHLELDPQFCDPLNENYRYSATSPLVIPYSGCREAAGIGGPPCSVTAVEPPMPERTVLYAPVPNPFNPKATLRFDLARSGEIELTLYDVRGRRVAALLDAARMPAGEHRVQWDGADHAGRRVASGVYFAQLMVDGEPVFPVRRLTLLK